LRDVVWLITDVHVDAVVADVSVGTVW